MLPAMLKNLLQLDKNPLFVIAGPCVIESADNCLLIGSKVKSICDKLGITYIFKASFDKANRSSNSSFRGPGIEDGLVVLKRVKEELGVPVLTDVHETDQPAVAAKVVDILQVPAFLARQTDLLHACGATGKAINIKKGQFMSPNEMATALEKVRATQILSQAARNTAQSIEAEQCLLGLMILDNEAIGRIAQSLKPEAFFETSHQVIFEALLHLHQTKKPIDVTVLREELIRRDEYEKVGGAAFLGKLLSKAPAPGDEAHHAEIVQEKFLLRQSSALKNPGDSRIMLTERGTFFGYNRLVNDFTGLAIMKAMNVPVIFDITHSTQQPAGLGTQSGGNPQYSPMLARAAVAAGVDGLFLECHPDPKNAKSDAATMLHLNDVEQLLTQCRQIAEVRKGW